MHVLVTCQNEEDPIKNEGARVFTKISPIISLWEFFQTLKGSYPAVLGRNWLKFELVRDIMVVLLTCKNKEDPIKNEGARVFTTLYIDFSDTQGQITLELVVVSSRNWNSCKLSCISLLPTRMKMIHSKMKV